MDTILQLHYFPILNDYHQSTILNIQIASGQTTFRDVLNVALDKVYPSAHNSSSSPKQQWEEKDWAISEVWNSLQREVAWKENPAKLLNQWGNFRKQVTFLLKHRKTKTWSNRQVTKRGDSKKRMGSFVLRMRGHMKDLVETKRTLSSTETASDIVLLTEKVALLAVNSQRVKKKIQITKRDLELVDRIETLVGRAQYLKKEADAKNELNAFQRSKMKEQRAILASKQKELANLEIELKDLRHKNLTSKKNEAEKTQWRVSVCDDGSSLQQQLNKSPAWSRSQSVYDNLSTETTPSTLHGVHGSVKRVSTKKRTELNVITRRNSEEGLVLKLSEEKRRSSLDSELDSSDFVKKLTFDDKEEPKAAAPPSTTEDTDAPSPIKKTSIKISVFQGKVQNGSKPTQPPPPAVPQSSKSPQIISEMCAKVKGILKVSGSGKHSKRPRVVFDSVPLLFSAALEGELNLFVTASKKVDYLNIASFQGVTPLHYAVCSGCMEIVRYLVSRGFDINRPDKDGWTPLHCAASCSNLEVLQYLIHNGSSIYMKTLEGLTPLRVAFEELEDVGQQRDTAAGKCLDYLLFAQQELGSINGGTVYALFDYEPHEEDGYDIDGETGLPFLPLIQNDALKIISKGGEQEREEEFWWVAENRLYQKGLVPCTLLGSYPRCKS